MFLMRIYVSVCVFYVTPYVWMWFRDWGKGGRTLYIEIIIKNTSFYVCTYICNLMHLAEFEETES